MAGRGAVRPMTTSGMTEAQVAAMLGAGPGVSPQKYRRVLQRAVVQGYLMRKNHKYYFIPSRSMQLPQLVVMRRRGRRGGRRSRRRSRRRSLGMFVETVRSRRRSRRRRSRRRGRTARGLPGAQVQAVKSTSSAQPQGDSKEPPNQ